ncbi:hypothetical protein NOI24_08395 [Neorhizobium galegae]|uniref:hypothetical protein n=1 Tax=Neorhizobium galegae TaxID=399 RepID=UPI002106709A|nr:hypothetical protein [Neorhizobium galegae]MCQ1771316.1 hypothetical protein [Neorhizobium galegae]MCQ1799798.1 hypothetical protein [Neorhizobium galegae]
MANKEIFELTAASALTGDELVHVVQSGNSRKATVDGIGTGIFKTAVKFATAQFEAATFKLFNAAGTPRALTFDTTALTADRALTVQDRAMTLGMVQLATGSIPTTAAVDWAVPAGVRRLTLILSAFSTNGTSVPVVQLKAGGVAETSGYTGSAVTLTSGSTVAGNLSVGFSLSASVAAVTVYHVIIELVLQGGNIWSAAIKGSLSNTAGLALGAGSKTLAGPADGLRLTTVGGTDIPDAGVYALYAEY